MKLYHRATIISGILGLVLILAVYIMLTSVNLVFMKDNEEIYRMEDVGIFSNLDVESEDVGGDYDFTYDTGKKTKDFETTVKEFLDSLLAERGNRLVVFVDEYPLLYPIINTPL